MKKLFLLLLLTSSACVGINGLVCVDPSEYERNSAQSYYDSFGANLERISDEKAKELFGCNYFKTTDYIYSYKPYFGKKKFILVRDNKAVTYAEEKE